MTVDAGDIVHIDSIYENVTSGDYQVLELEEDPNDPDDNKCACDECAFVDTIDQLYCEAFKCSGEKIVYFKKI
jgi:hypothetical protein